MARADRLGSTITGMVLSVLMVFGAVLFVAFFTFKPTDDSIKTVDFRTTVDAATKSGPFPPAVPVPVPDGWQATSVRYRVSANDPGLATWHLGFYITGDEYAAVAQSNGRSDEFLPEVTSRAKPEGKQTVNGQTWTRYVSTETGRRSLVYTANQLTTIVTGTLSFEGLGEFAASLKPL